MAPRLASAGKTDVGLKRTNNEDNFIMVPSHGLYVLADGMGGHASGQVASSMCVSLVGKFLCEMSHQPGFELPYKPNPSISREANLLVNAIKYANERVYIQSCKERSMEGMGTTVTAILNAPHGLVLAHVGDSRIYRVRKGQITQMSRDHSLLNHLLDTGELKPEDAESFSSKNVILRAIGLKENVDVDVKEVPREKGDIYMMCSDGLSDIVSDAQIAQAISSAPNLNEACNMLIGLALKAGGKDNVTVVCVGVEQDDSVQSQPSPSVSRTGMQPVKAGPGQMNLSQPLVAGAPHPSLAVGPAVQPAPLGVQGQTGRSASQPMMVRAPSYGNGMAPVPMPMPMSGHGGMVPMPSRGVPMPSVSMQPAQPLRMHSVREIVEKIPTARTSMPKPIGSGGRNSAAGMPTVPLMGKVRSGKSETETSELEMKQTVIMSEHVAPEGEDVGHPTVNDNPVFMEEASPVEMREVSKLSSEEKAELPETGLLFTAPPVGAETVGSQLKEPVFKDEDCDDEDDEKTLIQRPDLMNSNLAADILHESAATAQFKVPDSRSVPENGRRASGTVSAAETRESGAVLMSSTDAESALNSMPNERLKREMAEEASRGYVPPKDIVLPPHHDYDEDEDNIEIAGILFGECEDNDVTRQFRRPPTKKW